MAGERMSDFFGDWHALLLLLVAGVIPNQIWRMLGLWLGSGVGGGGGLLGWGQGGRTRDPGGRDRGDSGPPAGSAGERPRRFALRRGGRGFYRLHADAAVD